jgi:hypothetical protein
MNHDTQNGLNHYIKGRTHGGTLYNGSNKQTPFNRRNDMVIHIFMNYSGESYYAEDNKDNWLGDYDTADEAYTAMRAKYPNAEVYRYTPPTSYRI